MLHIRAVCGRLSLFCVPPPLWPMSNSQLASECKSHRTFDGMPHEQHLARRLTSSPTDAQARLRREYLVSLLCIIEPTVCFSQSPFAGPPVCFCLWSVPVLCVGATLQGNCETRSLPPRHWLNYAVTSQLKVYNLWLQLQDFFFFGQPTTPTSMVFGAAWREALNTVMFILPCFMTANV